MHIRPAETGSSGSGRPNEAGVSRKLRLGGASRIPVLGQTKTTDSPLRSLVSAIGNSFGSKTPSRTQNASGTSSTAKSSLSFRSSSARSSSSATATAPVDARGRTASSSAGRLNTNLSSAARLTGSTSSRVPSTPVAASRPQHLIAATPSRRSSLVNPPSSASFIPAYSNPAKNQNAPSTPATTRRASASRIPAPSTPATTSKPSSIGLRTPKPQNNPTTPSSKTSCMALPTPRRQGVTSTSVQSRSKSFFPTTPISKPSSAANPTTPVNSENSFKTPYKTPGSHPGCSFYTPRSTLAPSPLQPRNCNLSESSRRLHFGIDVAAMAEQENVGSNTPKPYTPVVMEATFSFDKHRLAQINARKNTAQSLKSPAQRVRISDLFLPVQPSAGRPLQQLAEDRSARFEEGQLAQYANRSPSRRRVHNSLF